MRGADLRPAAGAIEIMLGDASIRVVKGVDNGDVVAGAGGGGAGRPGLIAIAGGAAGMGGDATGIDFRRGVHRLVALVAQALRADPYGGEMICIPFRSEMIGSSCWRVDGSGQWFSQRNGWRAASSSAAGG